MKTSSYRKKTLIHILYLLVIGFVFGLLKTETILTYVSRDIVNLARVTSYITLGIGTFFYYFVIIASIFASAITLDLLKTGSHFNLDNFYRSVDYFIFFLMVNEVSKFLITLYSFRNFEEITSEKVLMTEIDKNSQWFELTSISDFFFVILGTVIFAFIFFKRDKNITLIEAIGSALPLIVSFLLFRFF